VPVCRERCWRYDWVIEVDVRKFFDGVHGNCWSQRCKHTPTRPWVSLYLRRWLAAAMQMPDGTVVARDRGTLRGPRSHP